MAPSSAGHPLRPLGWLLAALVLLAVASCGGDDTGPNGDGQAATPGESSEEGQAAPDGSPAPDAAEEQPSAGTEGADPSEDPAGGSGADVQATVEVRGGQVVGGVERIAADVGDTVALTVISDVADHVHVHGYDLQHPVGSGEPATVTVQADIPGVFEVELEDRGLKIAELAVGG